MFMFLAAARQSLANIGSQFNDQPPIARNFPAVRARGKLAGRLPTAKYSARESKDLPNLPDSSGFSRGFCLEKTSSILAMRGLTRNVFFQDIRQSDQSFDQSIILTIMSLRIRGINAMQESRAALDQSGARVFVAAVSASLYPISKTSQRETERERERDDLEGSDERDEARFRYGSSPAITKTRRVASMAR